MSAQLKALILCDFAETRENLLFIQSGGLTRLASSVFPARFSCYIGAIVYMPPDEVEAAHEMVLRVKSTADAAVIATVNVEMHQQHVTGLAPGEGRLLPIAVPLNAVVFPEPGEYDVQADLDGELAGDLSFHVVQTEPAQ